MKPSHFEPIFLSSAAIHKLLCLIKTRDMTCLLENTEIHSEKKGMGLFWKDWYVYRTTCFIIKLHMLFIFRIDWYGGESQLRNVLSFYGNVIIRVNSAFLKCLDKWTRFSIAVVFEWCFAVTKSAAKHHSEKLMTISVDGLISNQRESNKVTLVFIGIRLLLTLKLRWSQIKL